MNTPVTVITGASAGIGWELAKVFARNGHRLVLVARRKDKLDALADEIAASGQPKPDVIALDLSVAGSRIVSRANSRREISRPR